MSFLLFEIFKNSNIFLLNSINRVETEYIGIYWGMKSLFSNEQTSQSDSNEP